MTKRNRMVASSTLERLIGAKTVKIDVNHGSARRSLSVGSCARGVSITGPPSWEVLPLPSQGGGSIDGIQRTQSGKIYQKKAKV